MTRYRALGNVLGYRYGEEFDAEPEDEQLQPYLAGGQVVEIDVSESDQDDEVLPVGDTDEPDEGDEGDDSEHVETPW